MVRFSGSAFEQDERDFLNGKLRSAVNNGKTQTVQRLLEDVRKQDCPNWVDPALIHAAAVLGLLKATRLLLDHGLDANAINKQGNRPLHLAARNGNEDIVDLLLEAGAQVDLVDSDQGTVLHEAVLEGHTDICSRLIETGCDINAQNEYGFTALHSASSEGHEEVVGMLLQKGAKGDILDAKGRSSLHDAARYGYWEIVQNLLAFDTKVHINHQDQNGRTPLCEAVMANRLSVTKVLVESKAQLNILNEEGHCIIHAALKCADQEQVSYLLKHRASLPRET